MLSLWRNWEIPDFAFVKGPSMEQKTDNISPFWWYSRLVIGGFVFSKWCWIILFHEMDLSFFRLSGSSGTWSLLISWCNCSSLQQSVAFFFEESYWIIRPLLLETKNRPFEESLHGITFHSESDTFHVSMFNSLQAPFSISFIFRMSWKDIDLWKSTIILLKPIIIIIK